MKVHMCVQGSEDWTLLRMAMPTASCFDRILTPVTEKPSAQAEEYINEIVANILRGGPEDIKPMMNREMERGVMLEPMARKYYSYHTGTDVQQVGFVTTDDGRMGCSPDGLLGKDGIYHGGLELKIPLGKTHVKYLSEDKLPDAYKCQVHGCLAVTDLPVWDFMSYSDGLPPFLKRVEPNPFTKKLKQAVTDVCDQILEKLDSIRKLM